MSQLLSDVVVFLVAALVTVPVSMRLGFGSVLGYLLAGILIGPWGLRLITDVEAIVDFSELGVVLMMFMIGLEMQVNQLWAMRSKIFGYGGAQMAACVLVLMVVFLLLGKGWRIALMGAFALALSSTAMVITELQSRKRMDSPVGRASFGILLFQDMAAIPLIALIPLLGPSLSDAGRQGGGIEALKAIAMFIAIIVIGHRVLRFILPPLARSTAREMFTGFALLWVIGIALLMESVHLSMSLGAFVAGVLLADSQYKHEIETDIAPFKGLLLGLFFIAVGLTIDFGLLAREPIRVAVLVVALVCIKAVTLWFLAKHFRVPKNQRTYFAILLSQGGEFAFVVLSTSLATNVIDQRLASLVSLVVVLSMIATPLLLILHGCFTRGNMGASVS